MVAVGQGAFDVALTEQGLHQPTLLANASYGTRRALALMTALHDPDPPKMICIEEIDAGLHPDALDVVVEWLRDASTRTQLLAS